jgi:hypothetical protein
MAEGQNKEISTCCRMSRSVLMLQFIHSHLGEEQTERQNGPSSSVLATIAYLGATMHPRDFHKLLVFLHEEASAISGRGALDATGKNTLHHYCMGLKWHSHILTMSHEIFGACSQDIAGLPSPSLLLNAGYDGCERYNRVKNECTVARMNSVLFLLPRMVAETNVQGKTPY